MLTIVTHHTSIQISPSVCRPCPSGEWRNAARGEFEFEPGRLTHLSTAIALRLMRQLPTGRVRASRRAGYNALDAAKSTLANISTASGDDDVWNDRIVNLEDQNLEDQG